MFFRKIIPELEKRKIKYLAIGGVAVNLYGYNRITNDLDIILSFDEENVSKFVKLMSDLGFKPRVQADPMELSKPEKREFWKNEKNMKVFSFFNPNNEQEIIDIMIQDYIDIDQAFRNSNLVSDGNISVPLVSIDDLIRLKEISGRGRDLADLKILRKLKERSDEQS